MRTEKEIERRRKILMTLHVVLLWEIPKTLRLASVEYDYESAFLYFYFDEEIDERDKEALDIVLTEFISQFPYEEMCDYGIEFIRIDEPEPINYIGECFYARKEKYDE